MIAFDAATHTYAVLGAPYRSVTGALRDAGHLDDLAWFGSEAARARGKLVHALTLAIDMTGWRDLERPVPLPPWGVVVPRALVVVGDGGRLMVACPPELRGHCEAWQEVRELYGPRWDRAEEPIARIDLACAGTPDRMGIFNGRPSVVEIKTGAEAKWHGYQTAGYDLLDPLPFRRQRVAVYTRADGTFRVRTYRDEEDYACFARALGRAA